MEFKPKSLRQRALDYLGKREYSYFELTQKLKPFAEESDDISVILDDFKKRGWLSDARFTEQLVHARQSKFGSARVANELREKGVADDLIADAVEEVKVNELDFAREVCRKKFKASPSSREDWAKQARFLQSRGFGFDVIKKVLNEKSINESAND
ncbi:recombination regulator RecX [Methylotenera versatilis]|uniref:Regulatory protein RecX n=1 Tax=Methylotenera versatilis (strain 301) TaxID=666681 RepID=D7DL83_METV0|nr:recombination regulator RecX [Methylotenera versatilis]ADI30554.1 regulatory protein RecX [Methylotenera versatilis 301]